MKSRYHLKIVIFYGAALLFLHILYANFVFFDFEAYMSKFVKNTYK